MTMPTHNCPHCTSIRPDTETNGDLLECGSCGLLSRTDVAINSGVVQTVIVQNLNAIKERLRQEPLMETATEVRLRNLYVTDVTFLLRELGEI